MERRCGWGLLVVLCAGVALAQEPASTSVLSTEAIYSRKERSAPQTSAQEWGLTAAEWTRYQALMEGRRGIWSPGLDPLTALGVEAADAAERRHYAELWARAEYARVERELAFERAKTEAFARLYPAVRPVAYNPAPRSAAVLQGPGPHRLLAFTDRDCDQACRGRLQRVIALAGRKAVSLDLYVMGFAGDDAGLRQWAAQVLPAAALREGEVTLNHEAGALARLELAHQPRPLLLVRTADNTLSPLRE